mmetsp:Transcript_15194/g.20062  ORF Transcript_15194/g.20062 Transcript_15194/m.20062 type:complete len:291 (+) Transcript_15194:208-1080(+)|eukprot:CAMPEP_0117752694 /NCGR_PEP_ID=MMETSP0947-20121206/11773_1 /TAXON_ID=44440 /ORGANISM="Chattonella subsalsa, Strain CCMP2191" /LENGTH=290 /DNA_ID=CAMNT_0005571415 /DNA_START=167 /DNA_END=1039 /DNA_ORIENTATION=-
MNSTIRDRELSLASTSFAEAAPSIVISSLSRGKTKGLVMSSKEAALNSRLKDTLRKQIFLHNTTPSQQIMRTQYVDSCVRKYGTESGTGTSGIIDRSDNAGYVGFGAMDCNFIGTPPSTAYDFPTASRFATPASSIHHSPQNSNYSRPPTNQKSSTRQRRRQRPGSQLNSPTHTFAQKSLAARSQGSSIWQGTKSTPNLTNLSLETGAGGPATGPSPSLSGTVGPHSKLALSRGGQHSLGASPSTLHLERIKEHKRSLPELQVMAQSSLLQKKREEKLLSSVKLRMNGTV